MSKHPGDLIQIEARSSSHAPALKDDLQGFVETGDEGELGIEISEATRRRFISLMAGSLALAGLTGCTRPPTEMIMPYVDPPENVIPGRPKYYATAIQASGGAEGVLVESHLGRPTKVEGNPAHPANLGASSVIAQASPMNLYDPDRAQGVTHLGVPEEWNVLLTALNAAAVSARNGTGTGFRFLTETVISPTLGDSMRTALKSIPGAQWHQYDPAGAHSERAAAQTIFGRPVNTFYKLDAADVVAALDADFLACGLFPTRYARDFSVRRRRGERMDMNRLYVVESTMSATGGKADHRMPLRYTEIEAFARELVLRLEGNAPSNPTIGSGFFEAVLRDLMDHRGACVVIPGPHQSAGVHAFAHIANARLGNVGKTVIYTDPVEVEPVDQLQSLGRLVADMDAGQVETLVILGGNPVYNAPSDFRFPERLRKVSTSIHISSHLDETGSNCTWHLAESHFLEAWGDVRAFDGTVTIQQPLILPLYESRSFIEVLDAIAQTPGRPGHDIVRAYWQGREKTGDFEAWWRKSVHDGLIAGSALPSITPSATAANVAAAAPAPGGIEIVFRPDEYMLDGRYANNVWLQELPHPMTKVTWDNAIHLSAATAARLNIQPQERVELSFKGNSVEGSVWITPGQPDNSVTVHLGYGRTKAGRAGNGAGFDAYRLRRSDAMWTAAGAELRKTGTSYPLATTQMVQDMHGRDVALSATLDQYKANPDFAKQAAREPAHSDTLYELWNYTGYAWGMAIDLTACVNCNACVIACQAENNIPVVGKEQVLARRAMHWLRIDAYYGGEAENPSTYYQPVPCMQCEQAPCEVVCPTQATNHSSDGLNDMIYNRCVGTRYCSNNCPYKVRRFNFMLYSDWYTESWKLQRNPDVTVRSRGVMEKCTYCVQRIREAEIQARDEDRYISDGEIKTACQQACPTEAIIFGDINNRNNRVARLKAEKLNYAMLAELNTRPRTTYLAELRNPNPELKAIPR